MFRPAGLTQDELDAFRATLASPHDVRVVAKVFTTDRAFLGECDILAGQVDGRADDPVERVTTPTLLDPGGLFDGHSLDRMVQPVYRVTVPDVGVVEVPVITAMAVRPPNRDGEQVTIECQDRSALAMRGRPPKAYPKERNTVATIKQILLDCGESAAWIDFPSNLNDRTDDPTNVGWLDELRPLVQARALAATLDRHLYVDAAGVWRLEPYPSTGSPLADLSGLVTGPGPVEPPAELVNRVKVTGKKVGQRTITAVVTLKDVTPGHPLDPSNLKVGGVPQYFSVDESAPKANTATKARNVGLRVMRKHRDALVEGQTFNAAPDPTLAPFDTVRVGGEVLTVRSYSLPLTSGADMTLGYTTPLWRPR